MQPGKEKGKSRKAKGNGTRPDFLLLPFALLLSPVRGIDLAGWRALVTLDTMSRRISLALAASLSLAGCLLVHGQDATATPVTPDATNAAPAGDDVASLQAENAALKKEVSDAQNTIATLQAQLAQAGANHQTTATPPDATASDTNAAPAGPMKALPLDATNGIASAAAPGADATATGGKTYKVVKGDSLWKIAHKMYPGDTKNGVDKIQEANEDAIGGKPLKIGQILIIPQ